MTPKDVALAVIARIGVSGGAGHVIEYLGSTVRAMSMEGRMTLCNMTIEAGARSGMVSPDEKTIDYLRGRPYAPAGAKFDAAAAIWRVGRTALNSAGECLIPVAAGAPRHGGWVII